MRPEDRSGPVKRARLVALYELNGHPLEAARLLLALTPSSRMDLDQLLRVARLLTSGGRFSHAGEIYEKAMRLSDDPRTTGLAAVDSYLAGLDPGRAELVLNRLAKARPGPDLDARYATVYARTGRFKRARPLYANLAQVSETAAASSTEPRTNRLTALDSYLNARMYPEAQRLIDELVRETPGYDVDARQARLYHERRQFSRAITIYSRYPDDLAMQASRGWALTQMGCWKDAKHVFTGILNKDPSNWSARSGYQATLHHMPWDVFAIATRMYYSGYRGDRWLHTQNLRYADKRAVVTATHTRTDVIRPESRAVDFNEDAYGLKAYYQLDDKNSLQLLVLNFQNDDPLTDDGTVLGGEYRHVAGRRWSFGMEYDFSNFELGKIYQVATAAGLRFGEKVRCEVKGVLVRRDLVGSSKHPVSRAFRTSLTYGPHPRCVLGLS
ncbi:MAG: hypothetical protein HY815_14185, partial [Candidatus Riflebacteria bacterium]|nr:hypothetical protein [Candidatus Riflebacteria bacterium]